MDKATNLINVIKKYFKQHEIFFAALVFILLVCVFFAPIVFHGKTLTTSSFCGGVMPSGPYNYHGSHPGFASVRDPGAFAWQDAPLSQYIGDVFKKEHRIPLWNPNMGAGSPILAGLQIGTFFPLNWIPFLFSSDLAWDILMLLRIFFAGFFTYLFARKINLDKQPAFSAGIIFMFSGYTMAFLNMAHFSTECLIPLVLLSFECFIQKRITKNLLFAIGTVALSILPGMPEATAFSLMLGGLWFVLSLFFVHDEIIIKEKIKTLAWFVFMVIAAITLCAIQLLPFFEFLQLSFNSHANTGSGLAATPFNTVASFFYPYLFYPIYNWFASYYTIGMSASVLLLLAIFNFRSFISKERNIILFFSLFALASILKIFGSPLMSWIGTLPVFDTLVFCKYLTPELMFALAILAAYGYSAIYKNKIRFLGAKLCAVCMVILSLTIFSLIKMWPDFLARIDHSGTVITRHLTKILPSLILSDQKYQLLLAFVHIGAMVLMGLSLMLLLCLLVAKVNRNKSRFRVLIIFFIITELFLYRLFPGYASRYDTYKKAPYVNFLMQENKGDIFRIYGQTSPDLNAMLSPNVSSVFKIQDVRFLMALAVKRYFMFLQNVVGVSSDDISTIRFSGMLPLKIPNQYVDLLNVKYFLTLPNISKQTIVEDILKNGHVLLNKQYITPGKTVLNEKPLNGMMLHAPSKIIFPYTVKSDRLTFKYGLSDGGQQSASGVRFVITVISNHGAEEVLNDYVNPKDNKYTEWQEANIDLSKYHNKKIEIILDSQMVNGNNAFDQFFVSAFLPDPNIVYNKEIVISKNPTVMPRVFVVHNAELIQNSDAIFSRLKDPKFALRKNIIIEGTLPAVYTDVPQNSDKSLANIINYQDEKVEIDTKMKNAGFLVLLDQYYPGWKAYVDGKEAHIYPTDYIFRSVFLEKGDHKVTFVYDPLSYKIGKGISIFTLLFLLGLWSRRKSLV